MLAKQTPPPLDVNTMADLFLQRNMVREATSYLLEALAGDRPEHAALQSKLLEINLVTNPAVGGGAAGGVGGMTGSQRSGGRGGGAYDRQSAVGGPGGRGV